MAARFVQLAQDAQENGLACMVTDLLEQNLQQNPAKQKTFAKLAGKVAISARDAGVAMTLDFASGRCRVSDGLNEGWKLHIQADSAEILKLTTLKIRLGLPDILHESGRDLIKGLFSGSLKVGGLWRHPLLLLGLANVFSVE